MEGTGPGNSWWVTCPVQLYAETGVTLIEMAVIAKYFVSGRLHFISILIVHF